MAVDGFNLLKELEQIKRREQANLDALELTKTQTEGSLGDIGKIRLKSLQVVEAINEILSKHKH